MSDIIIRLGWDNSAARRGSKEAEGLAKKQQSTWKSVGSSLDKALVGGAIGGGVAVLADKAIGGVLNFSQQAIDQAGAYAGYNEQLKTVMGSAVAAKVELQKLEQTAKLPGMALDAAVAGSSRLQALGYSAEQARDILQQFSNTVKLSGGGAEDFREVIDAISDIASSGDIADEKIDRLTERSAILSRVMKDTFGASTAAGIRAAGVNANDFLLKLTEAQSKLARASMTRADEIKNIEQELNQAKASFGEAIAPIQVEAYKAAGGISLMITQLIQDTPKIGRGILAATKEWNPFIRGAERAAVAVQNIGVDPEDVRKNVEQFKADLKKLEAQPIEVKAEVEVEVKQAAVSASMQKLQDSFAKESVDLKMVGASDLARYQKVKTEALAIDKQIANLQSQGVPRESDHEKLAQLGIQRLQLLQQVHALEKSLADEAKAQGAAQAEKSRGQTQSLGIIEREIEITNLRINGQEQMARAMEDQLAIMQRAQSIAEATGVSQQRANDLAKQEVELNRQAKAEAESKGKSAALDDIEQELGLLQLRARGQDELANKLQREVDLKQRAASIAESTGVSQQRALELARQEQQLKDKVERRGQTSSDGERKRIQGYSREAAGPTPYDNRFRGLDAFKKQRGGDFFEGKFRQGKNDPLASLAARASLDPIASNTDNLQVQQVDLLAKLLSTLDKAVS